MALGAIWMVLTWEINPALRDSRCEILSLERDKCDFAFH
jgi:hypothetical protein